MLYVHLVGLVNANKLTKMHLAARYKFGTTHLKCVGRSDFWPYRLTAQSTSHKATTKFPMHPINRFTAFLLNLAWDAFIRSC